MGRPRNPQIESQNMHCKKHGLAEHRKYLGNRQQVMWQCVLCNRVRAAASRGVDIHFELCHEHGYVEHRTYQHADGYKRTLCVACKRVTNAAAQEAKRERETVPPAKRPICGGCFLELSVSGSCGCDA